MIVQPKRPASVIVPALLIGLAAAIFIGANAHLVYVAVTSEPPCLKHLKEKGARSGEFRAASPAC